MSAPSPEAEPGVAGGELSESSRRWQWLDRWLAPRWRALLTWVLLAAVCTLGLHNTSWLNSAADFFFKHLVQRLPFSLPASVYAFGIQLTALLLLMWFQPVCLRLGLSRTALWLCIGGLLWVLMCAFSPPPNRLSDAIPFHRWMQAGLFGHFFGLPGLAIIGRRTLPWMTLVGGASAAGFAYLFITEAGVVSEWLLVATNLIYGAVMLYGTKALTR